MERFIKSKHGWLWFVTAGLWTITLIMAIFTYGFKVIELFDIIYFTVLGANVIVALLNGILFTTGTFGILINGDEVILKRLTKKVIIKNDITDISYTKRYFRKAMQIKTTDKTYYIYNDYITDIQDLKNLIKN